MKMRRILVTSAICVLAASVTTCKDTPSEGSVAVAGWLAIEMTTPGGDDAGIMFVVSGGAIDSVRSTYPNVLSRVEGASSTRIVVGGNLVAGKIAEVWVPDVRKSASYEAQPLEVAARQSFAQRTLTGYVLAVSLSR
jgi:hypothetical protein